MTDAASRRSPSLEVYLDLELILAQVRAVEETVLAEMDARWLTLSDAEHEWLDAREECGR